MPSHKIFDVINSFKSALSLKYTLFKIHSFNREKATVEINHRINLHQTCSFV